MPGFFQSAREDIASVFDRDPAAKSWFEVVTCYPGLHALWFHRINHWFWQHGLRTSSRFFSQIARFFFAIEIHPGAQIGRRLFIDHGMGIIIGETTIIGDDCTLYQGVTLGGTGKEQGKRHPTLQNGVFVGAGAKILGNITVGENCRVGAGSVVLHNVPPNSTIVGVPGHIVLRAGKRVVINDPKDVRDPFSDVLIKLAREVKELRQQVSELTHQPLAEPDVEVAIILDRSAEAGEQDSKGEPGIAVYYDYQI
jgi:serine O-acetyltransferase